LNNLANLWSFQRSMT